MKSFPADFCRRVLERGSRFRCRLRGWSMLPEIEHLAQVEISPVRERDLVAGDIVLCAGPQGELRAHRITRKLYFDDSLRLRLKGDSNAEPDPGWIGRGGLLGRVTAVRTEDGWRSMVTPQARLRARIRRIARRIRQRLAGLAA